MTRPIRIAAAILVVTAAALMVLRTRVGGPLQQRVSPPAGVAESPGTEAPEPQMPQPAGPAPSTDARSPAWDPGLIPGVGELDSPTGRRPMAIWTPTRQALWQHMLERQDPDLLKTLRSASLSGTKEQRYRSEEHTSDSSH